MLIWKRFNFLVFVAFFRLRNRILQQYSETIKKPKLLFCWKFKKKKKEIGGEDEDEGDEEKYVHHCGWE